MNSNNRDTSNAGTTANPAANDPDQKGTQQAGQPTKEQQAQAEQGKDREQGKQQK